MNICAVINVSQLRKQDTQCSALVTRLFTEEFRSSAGQTFERYRSLTSHFFLQLLRWGEALAARETNVEGAWQCVLCVTHNGDSTQVWGFRFSRIKPAVFRDIAPCSVVYTDWRLRGTRMHGGTCQQTVIVELLLSYGLNQTTVFQTTLHELHHYFP